MLFPGGMKKVLITGGADLSGRISPGGFSPTGTKFICSCAAVFRLAGPGDSPHVTIHFADLTRNEEVETTLQRIKTCRGFSTSPRMAPIRFKTDVAEILRTIISAPPCSLKRA